MSKNNIMNVVRTDAVLFRHTMGAEQRRLSALHLLRAGQILPGMPVTPGLGLLVEHAQSVFAHLLETQPDGATWGITGRIAQRAYSFVEATLALDAAVAQQDAIEGRPIAERKSGARTVLPPSFYGAAYAALHRGALEADPIPRIGSRSEPWLPAPWAAGLAVALHRHLKNVGATPTFSAVAWAAALEEPGVPGREMARTVADWYTATEKDYLAECTQDNRREAAAWAQGRHLPDKPPSRGLKLARLGLWVRVRDCTTTRLPHLGHVLAGAAA